MTQPITRRLDHNSTNNSPPQRGSADTPKRVRDLGWCFFPTCRQRATLPLGGARETGVFFSREGKHGPHKRTSTSKVPLFKPTAVTNRHSEQSACCWDLSDASRSRGAAGLHGFLEKLFTKTAVDTASNEPATQRPCAAVSPLPVSRLERGSQHPDGHLYTISTTAAIAGGAVLLLAGAHERQCANARKQMNGPLNTSWWCARLCAEVSQITGWSRLTISIIFYPSSSCSKAHHSPTQCTLIIDLGALPRRAGGCHVAMVVASGALTSENGV